MINDHIYKKEKMKTKSGNVTVRIAGETNRLLSEFKCMEICLEYGSTKSHVPVDRIFARMLLALAKTEK
jgi:hypothetical protein